MDSLKRADFLNAIREVTRDDEAHVLFVHIFDCTKASSREDEQAYDQATPEGTGEIPGTFMSRTLGDWTCSKENAGKVRLVVGIDGKVKDWHMVSVYIVNGYQSTKNRKGEDAVRFHLDKDFPTASDALSALFGAEPFATWEFPASEEATGNLPQVIDLNTGIDSWNFQFCPYVSKDEESSCATNEA